MEIRAVLFDLDNTLFDHSTSAGLFDIYLQNYREAWGAFPDALPALQSLHDGGMPVGVITNGNHRQQTLKVSKIGLDPQIDRIFSSESTGHTKPSSEAFMQPCKSLGISPAQALYVGDNFRVDVEGARNAGLHAIHLTRDGGGPEGTIQSLAELVPLLGAGTGAANDSNTI